MKTTNKLLFYLFLLMFFLSQPESRGSVFWEGILSTTSNGQNVYGIVNNKLYKINDKKWIYKSDVSVNGLKNLIVANNNDIYAIYSTSLKKSVDGGINWVTISNPISKTINGAKIIENHIYLFFYQKIYRGDLSSDNINWELIYQGDYYDITVTQNNDIYITPGYTHPWTVKKSIDNGNTWENTNWPEDAWSTPYILNHSENTVFVGTYWEGILYSNDGGSTWHRSSGLPEGRGVNGIYVYNNQVFARVGDQRGVLGLYSSSNNGETFHKTNTDLSIWVEQSLSNLTASSNSLYISVGKRGFYISSDAGYSWQECNNGINNLKPHNVQRIQVEENGTIWVLMAPRKTIGPNPSYGVLKSVDRGVSWLEVDKELWEESMTLKDLLVTSDGKAYIANYKPGTFNLSIDGGTSWSNQTAVIDNKEEEGIGSTIDMLRANNSNETIFAGTYWDGILRSSNGGSSWVKLTDGLPSKSGVRDIFIDHNSIYAIIGSQAGYDGIYVSNDGGDSWSKVSSKVIQRIIKSEDILYGYGFSNELGYYTSVFYISYDSGQEWSLNNQGLPSTTFRIFDILIIPNSSKTPKSYRKIDKQLFVATNNGIYQMNFDNNTFSKVSSMIAFTLFWDSLYNEIIIGTENGITNITDFEHPNLSLEVRPENSGTVTNAGQYEAGEQVSISATANEGWEFVNWTGDTDYVDDPTLAYTTVTMPAYDISLTAVFDFAQPDGSIVYSDGDIPTDYAYPWVGPSSCPGIIEVTVPEGYAISGVDVAYKMTASNYAWISEQRSRIYSPTTGTGEQTYAQGSGDTEGTYAYVRTGLSFANGATGTVVFHMDAGRTWGNASPNTGCNTYYNKVDNNSWVLMVHYEYVDGPPEVPENRPVSDETIADGDTECFDATQTITVENFTIEAGGSATLIAGQSITLLPGTHVQSGGYFHAYITLDDTYCDEPVAKELDPEEIIVIVPETLQRIREDLFFKVYPNPTDGTFTLELETVEEGSDILIEVLGLLGGRVLSDRLPPQRIHTLSLSGHQPGIYIIRVTQGDKVGVERLIKR